MYFCLIHPGSFAFWLCFIWENWILQSCACFLKCSNIFLSVPIFNYSFTSHFGSVLNLDFQWESGKETGSFFLAAGTLSLFLVCGWRALTSKTKLVLPEVCLGYLATQNSDLVWLHECIALLSPSCIHRLKKRRMWRSFRRNQKTPRSQKIQEKWQSPKCLTLLVRKSGELAALCRAGVVLLPAGWGCVVYPLLLPLCF